MPRFLHPDRSAAIGARLCIARVTAGLTRVDLGRTLDVTAAQIEKYELGQTRLPAIMLPELGRELCCSPLFFLETDDAELARALLLKLPAGRVARRLLHRAVSTLKHAVREGASASTVQTGGRHAF